MRIVSKYKDYYDYVEYLYSPEGGDSNLVYTRNGSGLGVTVSQDVATPGWEFSSGFIGTRFAGKYKFKWVALAGYLYLIVNGKLLTEESEVFKDYETMRSEAKHFYGTLRYFREVTLKPTPSLKVDSLSRQLGQPVFFIEASSDRNPKFFVPSEIPNLGQLGFASVISAEQMYQTLAMYLANVIRENPDNTPPAHVSDKDRIVQHGFDLKTSFRGKAP